MITRLRSAAAAVAWHTEWYRQQENPATALRVDAGHAWRYHRTEMLDRVYLVACMTTDTVRDLLVEFERRAYDAWVASGRQWEAHLGSDRGPDARFALAHQSWEHCPDDCPHHQCTCP